MNDTLIIKKLKENRLTYVLMIIIYSVILFVSSLMLLITFVLDLIDNEGFLGSLIVFIIFARVALAFSFSIHGFVTTKRCINNKDYLVDFFKKNSIWKGFILTALVSPLFIIIYYKTYKIAGLYYVANMDEIDKDTFSYKPLNSALLYTLMVISIIIGVFSAFWDEGLLLYSDISRINSYSEEIQEGNREFLQYMPSIWFYYDGNKTDIRDYNVNFDVFDELEYRSGISRKDIEKDDVVSSGTTVYGYSKTKISYSSLYEMSFESDKKSKVKDMPIKNISIDYYTISLDNSSYSEQFKKAYITIDDYVIDCNSDYNTVREILKNVKMNHANVEDNNSSLNERIIINESEYNDNKNLSLDMSNYCSISFGFDKNTDIIKYISIYVR